MQTKREPVIPPELAERIADYVTALGYDSVHATLRGDGPEGWRESYRITNPDPSSRAYAPYSRNPEIRPLETVYATVIHLIEGIMDGEAPFGPLPEFWGIDVSEVFGRRSHNARMSKLRTSVATVDTTPAIRAFLSEVLESPELRRQYGLREPVRQAFPYKPGSVRPYTPVPGPRAILKTAEAVSFGYVQDAYADISYTAIPAVMPEGADLQALKNNLSRFCESIRSSNGIAGYGSSFDATLIVRPEGAFVIMRSRGSLAD